MSLYKHWRSVSCTFTRSLALAVLERLRSKRDELPQVLSTVDLDKVKQALELAVHGKLELPKEGEPALSPTSLLVWAPRYNSVLKMTFRMSLY